MGLKNIVKNGVMLAPPRVFIYGGAGQGKSTVASQANKPIFLPTEDGLGQIQCDSFPVSKTYAEFESYLTELKTQQHDYKTVVIDTVDWLEKIIWNDLCLKYSVSDIVSVAGGYGKGYALALGFFEKTRLHLQELHQKGMGIIFVSHTQTKDLKDPEVGDITQYAPKIHSKAKDLLCEWCDCVLFITRRFGSIKGEKAGGELGFKTRSTEYFYAKNRYNLPEFIPLRWDALESCIQQDWESKNKKG